ncbi:sigma-70 family RNA polymerase sigma factor [Candidatus Poribacteria bacterium]|nr:sigma-70 family RNA polymerase sigma factor [Candidatus Poribacteria bacterium]
MFSISSIQKPFLSKDKEDLLVMKAHQGDYEARNKLILSHSKFLISLCNMYAMRAKPDDLFGDAVIGFNEAIDKYKIGAARIARFAHKYVMRTIIQCDFNKHLLTMGTTTDYRRWKVKQAEVKLYTDNKQASITTLSEMTDLSVAQVSSMLNIQDEIDSLDDPVTDHSHENNMTYLDFVKDENSENGYEEVNIRVDLEFFLSHLSHQERFIVERRHGIPVEMTNGELGKRLGLTMRQVSKIFNQSMRKLQNLANTIKGTPEDIRMVVVNPGAVMAR